MSARPRPAASRAARLPEGLRRVLRLLRHAGARRRDRAAWRAQATALVEGPVLQRRGHPSVQLAATPTDIAIPPAVRALPIGGGAPRHVLLVDRGVRPLPGAAEVLARAAAAAPNAAVITADLLADGPSGRPLRLQGPSPDGQLVRGVGAGFALVAREQVGPELAGRPIGELLLRLSGSEADGHAHVSAPLATRRLPRLPGPLLARRRAAATREALRAWGREGELEVGAGRGGCAQIRAVAPARRPLVEIVVCLRDQPALTERCLRGVLEATDWPAERLRVQLVDNGSVKPATADLLEALARDPRVRVHRDGGPFSFARLNDEAVARSDADVVLLLNNDTAVVSPEWLAPLVHHALRPGVGAVGPLLLYPGGTVQHAGIALGLHDPAGHAFAGRLPSERGPLGRADDGPRNWLAVTAACLAIARDRWEAVGGFDERFAVAYNDVDLGVRLTEAGYRNLVVPESRLIHDESVSRGRGEVSAEHALARERFEPWLPDGDPWWPVGLGRP